VIRASTALPASRGWSIRCAVPRRRREARAEAGGPREPEGQCARRPPARGRRQRVVSAPRSRHPSGVGGGFPVGWRRAPSECRHHRRWTRQASRLRRIAAHLPACRNPAAPPAVRSGWHARRPPPGAPARAAVLSEQGLGSGPLPASLSTPLPVPGPGQCSVTPRGRGRRACQLLVRLRPLGERRTRWARRAGHNSLLWNASHDPSDHSPGPDGLWQDHGGRGPLPAIGAPPLGQ
jgi:hypothetical protein